MDAEILTRLSCEEGKITFRLFNEEYEWRLRQWSYYFGLPQGGERRTPNEFNALSFWNELTRDTTYDPSRAKVSHLQNSVFRYIH